MNLIRISKHIQVTKYVRAVRPASIKRIVISPKSTMTNDILFASHLVGESIMLFTFFYCSLNWIYLKRINNKK
jgi:hypothetical protein